MYGDSWWQTLRHLGDWLRPLRDTLGWIQGDDIKLADAVEKLLPLLESLKEVRGWAPAHVKSIVAKIEKRRPMLLGPVGIAGYLLHPKYRGSKLSPQEKSEALKSLATLSTQAGVVPPPLDDVIDFLSERPPYHDTANDLSAHRWWPCLYPLSRITPLATRLLSLPATQAAVERAFSATGFQLRERRDKLARPYFFLGPGTNL